jgi:hypothetical protein
MRKIPDLVVFTNEDGTPMNVIPEKVKEFVIMPNGDIVVKVEEGESYWFNSEGRHPKSYLIFKKNE